MNCASSARRGSNHQHYHRNATPLSTSNRKVCEQDMEIANLGVYYTGDELLVKPLFEGGRDAQRCHETAVRDEVLYG